MAMGWKSGALLGLGLLLVGAVLAVLLWQPEPQNAEAQQPLTRTVEPSAALPQAVSPEPESPEPASMQPADAELVGSASETLVHSVAVAASAPDEAQPTEPSKEPETARLQVRLSWVPNSEGPLPPSGGRPVPTASVDVDLASFRLLGKLMDVAAESLGLLPERGVHLSSDERARLTVVAGPDEGRRAVLGEAGSYEEQLSLGDLHPAVQVLELAVGEKVLARRSLTLVADRTVTIDCPEVQFEDVVVIVPRDESGEQLRRGELLRAVPTLDGRPAFLSDAGLEFRGGFAPGALLEAYSPRRVPFRGVVPSGDEGSLDLVLERADRLRLRSVRPAATPGAADFWLLPADPLAAKSWPYQRKSEALSDVGTTFMGLARKDVIAFVRQSGTIPRHAIVRAPAGGVEELQFELLPSAKITGRVHRRGTPVAGAMVQYHARNPLAATAALLDWPADAHQRAALPLLPPSFDRTATDDKGEFALADWPRQDSDHWLELAHPLLRVPHVIALPPTGRHFEFDLAGPPPQAPVGALVLTFPEALLGSVVEVRRDGAPHAEESLAEAELRIGPLALGRWRLHVEHEGRVLIDDQPLELKALLRVEVGVTGADDPPR